MIFMMGIFTLTGMNQEVSANSLDSTADVTLSKGVYLTAVPSFDFGRVTYVGDAETYVLEDLSQIGDREISWFDGTPPGEYPRVYASINDVPEGGIFNGSISFESSRGSGGGALASPRITSAGGGWYGTGAHPGYEATISFNGDKCSIIDIGAQSETGKNSYDLTKNTNEVWLLGAITTKRLNLPANLQAQEVTMTINWDIETAP